MPNILSPNRCINPIVSGSLTPATIFGPSLAYWGNSQNVTLNGSTVSAMAKIAGTATTDLSEGTAANQPTRLTSALNGFDAVSIDTTSKRLVSNATISPSVYLATVLRPVSLSFYGRIFSCRSTTFADWNNPQSMAILLSNVGSNGFVTFYDNAERGTSYSVTNNTWYTVEVFADSVSGTITHWLNGTQVLTTSYAVNLSSTNFGIGNLTDIPSLVDFTEVILASTATSTQQTAIRNFLRTKYAHY